VDDSFADWKRDRSHGHTLPHRPVFVKLYYLWKCFKTTFRLLVVDAVRHLRRKAAMEKSAGLSGRILTLPHVL
jgi:hypothetical protein